LEAARLLVCTQPWNEQYLLPHDMIRQGPSMASCLWHFPGTKPRRRQLPRNTVYLGSSHNRETSRPKFLVDSPPPLSCNFRLPQGVILLPNMRPLIHSMRTRGLTRPGIFKCTFERTTSVFEFLSYKTRSNRSIYTKSDRNSYNDRRKVLARPRNFTTPP